MVTLSARTKTEESHRASVGVVSFAPLIVRGLSMVTRPLKAHPVRSSDAPAVAPSTTACSELPQFEVDVEVGVAVAVDVAVEVVVGVAVAVDVAATVRVAVVLG